MQSAPWLLAVLLGTSGVALANGAHHLGPAAKEFIDLVAAGDLRAARQRVQPHGRLEKQISISRASYEQRVEALLAASGSLPLLQRVVIEDVEWQPVSKEVFACVTAHFATQPSQPAWRQPLCFHLDNGWKVVGFSRAATAAASGLPPERFAFELVIEELKPLSAYHGKPWIAAAVDPRFVLVGRIKWTQRPEVFGLQTRQSLGIHSPSQLGITEKDSLTPNTSICLIAETGIVDGGRTWRLLAPKPDLVCPGGG